MANILRDSGLSEAVVPLEAETVRLAGDFSFTEGPLWLPDGDGPGFLLFQDSKGSKTHKLSLQPGSKPELIRSDTRGANGQTFGLDGLIYFCEQDGRRVSRMKVDGSGVETVVETFNGKRLNSPNDIVCRSDGLLFFTDPPYGIKRPEDKELPFQGVFSLRIEPAGEPTLSLLADDFDKPNGLAFSPDEKTLYVNDTAANEIRAFEVAENGAFVAGSGRVVATVDPAEPGGPDGLKVDRAGRLYAAVAQGIWVFEPGVSFRLLGIIALPKRPANLAWCGREGDYLGIMTADSVYGIRLETEGILPPFTP